MWSRKRHIPEETAPQAMAVAPAQTEEEQQQEIEPEDWREPSLPGREQTSAAADPDHTDDRGEGAGKRPRKRGLRIGQFFTGGVLSHDEFTRRLPVIVYVVFLMLLYIANGFRIQHKHSTLEHIADELTQLKTRAVTSSAVRMTLTRQSEIERLLRERHLPLTLEGAPPKQIDE